MTLYTEMVAAIRQCHPEVEKFSRKPLKRSKHGAQICGGIQKILHSIKKNASAFLLLLDQNPDIKLTVTRGSLCHHRCDSIATCTRIVRELETKNAVEKRCDSAAIATTALEGL